MLNEMRMIAERASERERHSFTDFFPYDSLHLIDNHDKIKNLGISDVKAKRLPKEVFQCQNLESLEVVNIQLRIFF